MEGELRTSKGRVFQMVGAAIAIQAWEILLLATSRVHVPRAELVMLHWQRVYKHKYTASQKRK